MCEMWYPIAESCPFAQHVGLTYTACAIPRVVVKPIYSRGEQRKNRGKETQNKWSIARPAFGIRSNIFPLKIELKIYVFLLDRAMFARTSCGCRKKTDRYRCCTVQHIKPP